MYSYKSILVSLLVMALQLATLSDAIDSTWVSKGSNGKLVYKTDSAGNRIPDFSYCGYEKGSALPSTGSLKIVKTINAAGSGDMYSTITSALNIAKDQPLVNGYRGAVKLGTGVFNVGTTINIATSGVVLLGSGTGTRLVGTGTKERPVVQIGGGSFGTGGSPKKVLNDVGIGQKVLQIQTGLAIKVGSDIVIKISHNSRFVADNKMNQIPGETPWASFVTTYENAVTKVETVTVNGGQRMQLTLESSIMDGIREIYGGATVELLTSDSRVYHAGIADLTVESTYNAGNKLDVAHANTGVTIRACRSCWAQKMTCKYFSWGCVDVGKMSKYTSVESVTSQDMWGKIEPGWRYPFAVTDGAQLTLFRNCKAIGGRHNFVAQGYNTGPNVWLDCTATDQKSESGPHLRWSTAGLYDRVNAQIQVMDRGDYGTAHGWAGNAYVMWNCEGAVTCQSPPSGMSWVVGLVGSKIAGRYPRTECPFEYTGQHVGISSLYLAQKQDRTGIASAEDGPDRPPISETGVLVPTDTEQDSTDPDDVSLPSEPPVVIDGQDVNECPGPAVLSLSTAIFCAAFVVLRRV